MYSVAAVTGELAWTYVEVENVVFSTAYRETGELQNGSWMHTMWTK